MRTKRNILAITGFLIISLVLSWGGIPADEAAAGDRMATESLAIILLVDISGSMARTDPERLRETAAGVFIDMLSPEDYLGFITFDDKIEIVIPMEQVRDYQNKRRIKEILFPKLDPRGFTDYVGALETVFEHMQEAAPEEARPVVVFLTDGDPNPYSGSRNNPVFMEGYLKELWDLMDRYAEERYPIYSVGFSDEIQPGILEKISTNTRGGYHILRDSTELLVTFFRVLGDLKNRQALMEETVPAGEGMEFSFVMDPYTRQVNLILAGKDIDFSLKAPDGTGADAGRSGRWHARP